MSFICSSVALSIDVTSWIANTGFPSTFGSKSAIRLAPWMPATSSTTLTIGTGQNSPPVVFIFSATESESARFM